MTDRYLVVLDSLLRAASDIRHACDAVRDGFVGALDDEVAVGHEQLQAVVGEFLGGWQSGVAALLGGQDDIADRLDACVSAYAISDQAAADAYLAARSSPP